MKLIKYNNDKNEILKESRGVGFEDVLLCISEMKLLDNFLHPNQLKYSGQKIFVIEIKNYIYLVPYVETEDEIFLKTIIPSRKMSKKYKEAN